MCTARDMDTCSRACGRGTCQSTPCAAELPLQPRQLERQSAAAACTASGCGGVAEPSRRQKQPTLACIQSQACRPMRRSSQHSSSMALVGCALTCTRLVGCACGRGPWLWADDQLARCLRFLPRCSAGVAERAGHRACAALSELIKVTWHHIFC